MQSKVLVTVFRRSNDYWKNSKWIGCSKAWALEADSPDFSYTVGIIYCVILDYPCLSFLYKIEIIVPTLHFHISPAGVKNVKNPTAKFVNIYQILNAFTLLPNSCSRRTLSRQQFFRYIILIPHNSPVKFNL